MEGRSCLMPTHLAPTQSQPTRIRRTLWQPWCSRSWSGGLPPAPEELACGGGGRVVLTKGAPSRPDACRQSPKHSPLLCCPHTCLAGLHHRAFAPAAPLPTARLDPPSTPPPRQEAVPTTPPGVPEPESQVSCCRSLFPADPKLLLGPQGDGVLGWWMAEWVEVTKARLRGQGSAQKRVPQDSPTSWSRGLPKSLRLPREPAFPDVATPTPPCDPNGPGHTINPSECRPPRGAGAPPGWGSITSQLAPSTPLARLNLVCSFPRKTDDALLLGGASEKPCECLVCAGPEATRRGLLFL